MPDNPHFETLADWKAAEARIGYAPRIPRETLGHELQSLRLFVRDHRLRDVPPEKQALEAYYGAFTFSQSRPGEAEARRLALETSYGSDPREEEVSGREARVYERGPEPPEDDPDPRMPAVFCRAAWGLRNGKWTGPVESPFGLHFIKRVEWTIRRTMLRIDPKNPGIRRMIRTKRKEDLLFQVRKDHAVNVLY